MLETHQPYNVIFRTHDIEYRRYPAATFAQVRVRGPYTIRLNSGFRELSYYVTGGNYQHQSLPIVAPVVMSACGADESHVRMYLGNNLVAIDAPTPLSHAVEITTHAPLIVAAIVLDGLFLQSSMETAAIRLQQSLIAANIAFDTNAEYRFYTSPWQQLGRRGDVTFRLKQFPFPLV